MTNTEKFAWKYYNGDISEAIKHLIVKSTDEERKKYSCEWDVSIKTLAENYLRLEYNGKMSEDEFEVMLRERYMDIVASYKVPDTSNPYKNVDPEKLLKSTKAYSEKSSSGTSLFAYLAISIISGLITFAFVFFLILGLGQTLYAIIATAVMLATFVGAIRTGIMYRRSHITVYGGRVTGVTLDSNISFSVNISDISFVKTLNKNSVSIVTSNTIYKAQAHKCAFEIKSLIDTLHS